MHKGNNTAKGTTNRLLQRWNKSLSLWILGCNNLKVELPRFRVWEKVQESIVRRSMLRKIEILLRKENRKRPWEQERARAERGKGPVTKTRRSSMYACHVNLKLNGSLLISGTRKRREQGPKILVGWHNWDWIEVRGVVRCPNRDRTGSQWKEIMARIRFHTKKKKNDPSPVVRKRQLKWIFDFHFVLDEGHMVLGKRLRYSKISSKSFFLQRRYPKISHNVKTLFFFFLIINCQSWNETMERRDFPSWIVRRSG